MTWQGYISNLVLALQGKPSQGANEQFQGQSPQADIATTASAIILYIIIVVGFCVMYSYGAARTSYCYNVYIGNSEGSAWFWSILAFFFSGFYYPIHALFLSPLCSLPVKAMIGGRRR